MDNNYTMCKCNEKEVCCKMQKGSLRIAVESLKKCEYTITVEAVLDAMCNLLSFYKCVPSSYLIERVRWLKKEISKRNDSLNLENKIQINMLIAELEAFLN